MAFQGVFVVHADVEGDFVGEGGVTDVDAADVFNAPVGDEEGLRDKGDLATFDVKFHPVVDVAETKGDGRGVVENDVVDDASPNGSVEMHGAGGATVLSIG